MKCKHCDGTGTTNWCINGTFKECPYCGGTGEVDRFNAVDVLKVMEMVKKPHTNEEWIHTLNTEQLAEWILDVSDECFDCGKSDNGDCPFGKAQGVCTCINKDSVVEWLKQPYREG